MRYWTWKSFLFVFLIIFYGIQFRSGRSLAIHFAVAFTSVRKTMSWYTYTHLSGYYYCTTAVSEQWRTRSGCRLFFHRSNGSSTFSIIKKSFVRVFPHTFLWPQRIIKVNFAHKISQSLPVRSLRCHVPTFSSFVGRVAAGILFLFTSDCFRVQTEFLLTMDFIQFWMRSHRNFCTRSQFRIPSKKKPCIEVVIYAISAVIELLW